MYEDIIGKFVLVIENVFLGVNDLKLIIVYYGFNMGILMEFVNNLVKLVI